MTPAGQPDSRADSPDSRADNPDRGGAVRTLPRRRDSAPDCGDEVPQRGSAAGGPVRHGFRAVFDNYFSVRCGDDNFMTVF